ncbi:MAG TPA: hypothetical protein VGM06_17955 [Polyangiaceae bacterium]
MPKPRERTAACEDARTDKPAAADRSERHEATAEDVRAPRPPSPREQGPDDARAPDVADAVVAPPVATPAPPGDVILLRPNVISVRHWDRLLGGLLYATQPRVDWANLLRRSFAADVLECPKCHGRLRVVAVITEREPVRRILAHLGLPTDLPPLAHTRDPTDDLGDDEAPTQLALGLA